MKIARKLQILRQEGWLANHNGDVASAERLYLEAHELASELPEEAALVCNILADFYCDQKQFSDAERFARQGLAIRETLDSQILVGNDLMMLAMVLEESGQLAAAEPYAQRGSDIYEMQYGPEHSEVHRMQSVLARIQTALQRDVGG
ncbi:tetratricopeptide repeat protein [Rhodopirellula europaea]|uniref:Uncharacterized protein n=1 Tax=Rhodopirellula europaea 6C TaxID=1263867 RepID=M2AA65_9BACT|nr:tetratricopeptide repeat protein [Rhodopirellula europaea]EMB13320.1 hypothetical protein RE6C_05929 [Rhodopirellula europaea 6C]